MAEAGGANVALEGGKGGVPKGGGSLGGAAGDAAGAADALDEVPPIVVDVLPDDGARGITPLDALVIRFSEPMDRASVQAAYFQCAPERCPDVEGEPSFAWNEAGTEVTVSPGLSSPRSEWIDSDQPGSDTDLAMSFGVGPLARDTADNPVEGGFTSTFYLLRQVQHRFRPCLGLSGTASELEFVAAAAPSEAAPCTEKDSGSAASLAAGDRDGQAVKAVVTYSLSALSEDVALGSLAANLTFFFDEPVGTPYRFHGDLTLESIDFGRDTDLAFETSGQLLGILALASTEPSELPTQATKDVSVVVSDAVARRGAREPLVQFRAGFSDDAVDHNATPDYFRLSIDAQSPTLVLSYECSACPDTSSP